MRKKQFIEGAFAFTGIVVLILDSNTALNGAAEGIALCMQTMIPSLFPFFLFSIWLTGSMLGSEMMLLRPLGRLFGIPEGAHSILIPAFLGGYPVGAQGIAAAYRSGRINKTDAERMLAYCSNAGPSFLFGIIGSMFPDKRSVWLLWGIHIFSAWMVSRFFLPTTPHITFSPKAGTSLPAAMSSAVKTMGTVCGWVIVFRVLLRFLDKWGLWLLKDSWQVIIAGFLELSNGCCSLHEIADDQLRFLVCSGMLAFGGICVTMQTASVAEGLSLRNYCIGKLLQCAFSLVLSFAALHKLWYVPVLCFFFPAIIGRKSKKSCSIPKKAVV